MRRTARESTVEPEPPRGTAQGVVHVYARVTTVDGDPGRIDDVISFVKGTVEPLVRQQPGSAGLAMFVDRDKGRVTVTTAWSTAEACAASDGPLAPVRGEAARILGGQARPEEFELAVRERVQPAQPGYWNRTTRLAVPVERMEQAIAAFRDRTIPALRQIEGFCGAVLLVDRSTGTAVGATTWVTREHLQASREAADRLRHATADSSGARVTEVTESEIAIAGIGAPQQHEDAFRRAYAAMSASGDLDDLDNVVLPAYIEHAALPPGTPPGVEGLKVLMRAYRVAFPDLTLSIEKYLEQDDTGCAVVRMTGTNTGSYMGAPPSGQTMDITGIDIVRVVDGKCSEHWGAQDDLGMLSQLGLLAIPQQVRSTIELPTHASV